MSNKQNIRDNTEVEAPKLLRLLSYGGVSSRRTTKKGRMFECKTCKKTFPTFQALGGHSTGHKRPREEDAASSAAAPKKSAHECPVCGLVFPLGQALGGHMRRHKDVVGSKSGKSNNEDDTTAAADNSCGDEHIDDGVVGNGQIRGDAGGNIIPHLGASRGCNAWSDLDLELRLGLQTRPPVTAVNNDGLLTTLRLGIEA